MLTLSNPSIFAVSSISIASSVFATVADFTTMSFNTVLKVSKTVANFFSCDDAKKTYKAVYNLFIIACMVSIALGSTTRKAIYLMNNIQTSSVSFLQASTTSEDLEGVEIDEEGSVEVVEDSEAVDIVTEIVEGSYNFVYNNSEESAIPEFLTLETVPTNVTQWRRLAKELGITGCSKANILTIQQKVNDLGYVW